MLLAHLLPHLDAEISRLQRARDLLASITPFADTYQADRYRSATRTKSSASVLVDTPLLAPLLFAPSITNSPPADQASEPAAKYLEPAMTEIVPGEPAASRVVVPRRGTGRVAGRDRRSEPREHESRPDRRRRPLVVNTALRGSVPAGPIVASAEEVRRSQESKVVQAIRAAEVKKAGAKLVPHFGWRSPTNEVRSLDVLLQRLINIGEEDTDRAGASQLPQLGQH